MSAGENVWNKRKGSRILRYGDCVLRGYCVRELDKRWKGRVRGNCVLTTDCVKEIG